MSQAIPPVSEQVVVIAGASSGIGREAALRFAARGARVVVSARGEAKLRSLVAEITTAGGQALAEPADVAHAEEMERLAERAVAAYGRIDTWVHSAGVGLWAEFKDTTPEEWERVIDVNLNGVAHAARAALPHLRETGGALIVISSSEGPVALPFQAAYGASKAGVHALLRSLRVELRREGAGVRVTEIMPSGINTPIFSQARTKLGVKPKPPGLMYEPNVVVDAILFAAEHPARRLAVGSPARVVQWGQALSAPLMDRAILALGTRTQRTDEAKPPDAPTNLFEPIDAEQRTRGDFGEISRSWSGYTWLQLHPRVKGLLGAALIGSAMALALRRRRDDSRAP